MHIDVVNLQGHKVKQLIMPECLKVEMKTVLFKEVIDYFQSKERVNYAHVKKKEDFHYSKKKKIKQKGTGYSRCGNAKQSHHRGGVTLFGPGDQVYAYKIPKRKVKMGLAMVLGNKIKHKEVFVCDSLDISDHKTKNFIECMKKFSVNNCLFVDNTTPVNFSLSMRNVPNMNIINTSALNALNASRNRNIFITERALMEVERRINGK